MWGLVITNRYGDPTKDSLIYGEAIAHEIGHVLGLGHRGDKNDNESDNLEVPGSKNLMYPTPANGIKEDLDLIQVAAVLKSDAFK